MRYELNTTTNELYRINEEKLEATMKKASEPVFEDNYGGGVCFYANESIKTWAKFAEKAGVNYSDFAEIVFESDKDYETAFEKAHAF